MDLSDPIDFSRVFAEHEAAVRATAARVLNDAHATEDVVQEVFAALWRRPSLYDPTRGPLGAYLRLSARSRAIDTLRTTQTRTRTFTRLVAEHGESARFGEDVARGLEQREEAGMLRGRVRSLPAPQREAVAMTFYGGLSSLELAEHMDAPTGTAKSRLRLGLMKLAADETLSHLAPPPPRAVLVETPKPIVTSAVADVDLLCLAALGLRRPV